MLHSISWFDFRFDIKMNEQKQKKKCFLNEIHFKAKYRRGKNEPKRNFQNRQSFKIEIIFFLIFLLFNFKMFVFLIWIRTKKMRWQVLLQPDYQLLLVVIVVVASYMNVTLAISSELKINLFLSSIFFPRRLNLDICATKDSNAILIATKRSTRINM